MAYEGKTDWKYDDIVTERDLNRIEQGVQDSQEKADEAVTKAGQAENNSKAYTDQQIQLVTETGIPKLVTYPYVLTATEDGQTDFVIPLETFDKETDTVMVVQNSTVLTPEGYVIEERTISLLEEVEAGTEIFVKVFKNVPIGTEGAINGAVIAVNSLPNNRVQGFDELFTSVSDGKSIIETAITDKGGSVSKQQNTPTFNELNNGIKSIPQAIGDATSRQVLEGYTFSSEISGIGTLGAMTNRTGHINAQSIKRSGSTLQLRPQPGYYDGTIENSVQINHPTISPENIREGVNFANSGLVGTLKYGTPQVYEYGQEYIQIVQGSMRQQDQYRATFSKENDYIRLASTAIGQYPHYEGNPGWATAVTNSTINLSNVRYIFAGVDTRGTQTIQIFLIASKDKFGNHNVFEARQSINTNNFMSGYQHFLDVTDLFGEYYVRVHHVNNFSNTTNREIRLYNILTVGLPQ